VAGPLLPLAVSAGVPGMSRLETAICRGRLQPSKPATEGRGVGQHRCRYCHHPGAPIQHAATPGCRASKAHVPRESRCESHQPDPSTYVLEFPTVLPVEKTHYPSAFRIYRRRRARPKTIRRCIWERLNNDRWPCVSP